MSYLSSIVFLLLSIVTKHTRHVKPLTKKINRTPVLRTPVRKQTPKRTHVRPDHQAKGKIKSKPQIVPNFFDMHYPPGGVCEKFLFSDLVGFVLSELRLVGYEVGYWCWWYASSRKITAVIPIVRGFIRWVRPRFGRCLC